MDGRRKTVSLQDSTQLEPKGRRELKAEAKAAQARMKAMRPWYRKPLYVVGLAILAVVALIVMVNTGTEDTGTDTAAEEEAVAGAAEAVPGIGEAVRDGDFEFTVAGIDCGSTEVGDDPFTETAQGQFCLLTVRVENIGSQSQTLFAMEQFLLDADGREFAADDPATFANDPMAETFLSEINPGNNVEGEIVFDVPADVEIVEAELHDSTFSDGVRVSLR
jgi:hypothetical protein